MKLLFAVLFTVITSSAFAAQINITYPTDNAEIDTQNPAIDVTGTVLGIIPWLGFISCNDKAGQFTGGYTWKVEDVPLVEGQNTIKCKYIRLLTYETDTVTINWVGSNDLPIANFDFSPIGGKAPVVINLNGSSSHDPDGSISNYYWSIEGIGAIGSGQALTHTFSTAGTFNVKLEVADNRGGRNHVIKPITISPSNILPVANFEFSPVSGIAPLQVSFNGALSSDSDGILTDYLWNFGNGATASGLTASNIFTQAGTYQVSLTVQDNDGATHTKTVQLNVLENSIPNASLAANPLSGVAPLQVTFDASMSYDVDGPITEYSISFGDSPNEISSSSPYINHTYITPGNYTARLKVKDSQGDWSEYVTTQIDVIEPNQPPVLGGNQSFEMDEDGILNFTLNAATDPEGEIVTYQVMTMPTDGIVSNCLNGTNSLSCQFVPRENFSGTVSIQYKANDGIQGSTTVGVVTVIVHPLNDVPVAGDDLFLEMDENTSLDFEIPIALDSDGDELKYVVVVPTYDGVLSGCLNEDDDRTCTFTPKENFTGETVFRYAVEDATSSVTKLGSVTINVRMTNIKPMMAEDVTFESNEDQKFVFELPPAVDPDSSEIRYRIVTEANNGILSGCLETSNDLSCEFIPDANFTGIVTFSYIANDGRIDSEDITEIMIRVNPINDTPVAGEDQDLSVNENSFIEFQVSKGIDVDDGDELTYHIVSGPNSGSVSGCLDGTPVQDCKYIPAVNFRGEDVIIYEVKDATTTSVNKGTITLNVLPVNRAPVIAQMYPTITAEDSPAPINLLPGIDEDFDQLTYFVEKSPSHGKLLNCLNGTNAIVCNYVPDEDYYGEDSFSYFAFDGKSKSNIMTVSVNVTPVNDLPEMGVDQNFYVDENQTLELVLSEATDVETTKELLTYTLVNGPQNGVLSGCLSGTPDRSCRYTPNSNFNGEDEFTYLAFDGENSSIEVARVKFIVRPINDAPKFLNSQYIEVAYNTPSSITLEPALDIDGNNLNYELIEGPLNGTISGCLNNTSDLNCEFNPNEGFDGVTYFTIKATDGALYSDIQRITVKVIRPPQHVVQISGEYYNTCALFDNGAVSCWGLEAAGNLGLEVYIGSLGDDEHPSVAPMINLGEKAISITTGSSHSCALLESKKIKCWGTNYYGEAGWGEYVYPGLPQEVNLGEDALQISAGSYHTCALLNEGRVKCWGINTEGHLGLGHTENIGDDETPNTSPYIDLGEPATYVASGQHSTCAILESGKVRCWGLNQNGVLGTGDSSNIGDDELPKDIPALDFGIPITKVSVGYGFACALQLDKKIKCWGKNWDGQLGYGNTETIGDNETVSPSVPDSISFSKNVLDVSVGWYSSCALFEDKSIQCWGSSSVGQLGLASTTSIGDDELPSSVPPVQVGGNATQILVGGNKACALLEGGLLRCWGFNYGGQLGLAHTDDIGDNEYPDSQLPVSLLGFEITSFFTSPNLAEVNEYIYLNSAGSSPGPNETIQSYSWDFGDGNTSSEQNPAHVYSESGNYYISLVIVSSNGKSASFRRPIAVSPEPLPIPMLYADLTSGPASLKVNFNGINSLPSREWGAITNYQWDFGDGESSSEVTVEHIYRDAGIYEVSLTVTDSLGKIASQKAVITVFDSYAPSAHVALSHESGRVPFKVAFDGSQSLPGSFDGSIVRYRWNFGDGSFSEEAVVEHIYTQSGNFSGSLTVTDDRGKSNTKNFSIAVAPELFPIAKFQVDSQTGHAPLTVTLDASESTPAEEDGSITNYSWDFGDGTVGNGETVSHTFTGVGDYTVKLTVTDNVGKTSTASLVISAVLETFPVAAISTSSITGNLPLEIDFSASNSNPSEEGREITNYEWDFGDGSTAVGENVSYTFTTLGSFNVKLKVTDDSNKTASSVVTITTLPELFPVAKIAVTSNSGRVPLAVAFSATASTPSTTEGEIVSYEWDFGDGNQASGLNVSHTFTEVGTHNVKLTVRDNLNKSSSEVLAISALSQVFPVAAISASNNTGNVPFTLSFDGGASTPSESEGSITQYAWDFGDGTTGTGKTVNHNFTQPGVYNVRLTVIDSFERTNATVLIVNALPGLSPKALISADISSGQVPLNVNFSGSGSTPAESNGSILSYEWNFGDGSTANGESVGHTFEDEGVFYVTLKVTDNTNKEASTTFVVTALPETFPVAVIETDRDSGNVPFSVAFNGGNSSPSEAGGYIVSYEWDLGDGTTKAGSTISHLYTSAGTFNVRLTVTDNLNKKNITSYTINSYPELFPEARLTVSTNSGHAPLYVEFYGHDSTPSDPSGSIVSYSWDFGDGSTAVGGSRSHTFTKVGVFNVILTVRDNLNKTHSTTYPVTVLPEMFPVARIEADTDVGHVPFNVSFSGNQSTPSDFMGSIVSYSWDFGDGTTAIGMNVTHSFLRSGIYNVRLKVTDNLGKMHSTVFIVNAYPELFPYPRIAVNTRSGFVPFDVTFDGRGSNPSIEGGEIIKYEWNFGDGTTAIGEEVTHQFINTGIYQVSLKVTDDLGKTRTTWTNISANKWEPPVANFTIASSTPTTYVPFTIVLSAFPSKPGSDGEIAEYRWTFSDGTEATGSSVTKAITTPGDWDFTLKITTVRGNQSVKTIRKNYEDSLSVNIAADYETNFVGHFTKFVAELRTVSGEKVQQPIQWISSDPTIMTVAGNGIGSSLKEGITYVQAKAGNTLSEPLKIRVLPKTSIPQLMIPDDFFTSRYEEHIQGGVFNLSSKAYVMNSTSSIHKAVLSSGFFKTAVSLSPGSKVVELRAHDGASQKSSTREITYFDGLGKSLLFDTSSEALINLERGSLAPSFTIEFLIRLSEDKIQRKIFEITSENQSIAFEYDNKGTILAKITSGFSYVLPGSISLFNNWQHISLAFDATLKKFKLYQNGRLVSQRYIHETIDFSESMLHGIIGGSGFEGLLDEIRIYNRARTQQEIRSHMFNRPPDSSIPNIYFDFEGSAKQVYSSDLNKAEIILGSSTVKEMEDPAFRLSSQVIAQGVIKEKEGILLQNSSLQGFYIDLPPFAVTEDTNLKFEAFDTSTPGFVDEIFKKAGHLVRVSTFENRSFKNHGSISIPLKEKKYVDRKKISLYRIMEGGTKSFELIYPGAINEDTGTAHFPLYWPGTYFTSYDESLNPEIEYNGSFIYEEAFTYGYTQSYTLILNRPESFPVNIELSGDTDGAILYKARCKIASLNQEQLPITISVPDIKTDDCFLYYKKQISADAYIYLSHSIKIYILN